MFEFLDRIEAMGERGAYLAIGLAGWFLVLSVGLGAGSLWIPLDEYRWTAVALGAGCLLCLAASMVLGVVGAKQYSNRHYPSAAEVFPSLPRDAFIHAVHTEDRPLCVCAACLIHLPAQFSTGGCPRCASSVDYYEIVTDEDAQMVIVSLA